MWDLLSNNCALERAEEKKALFFLIKLTIDVMDTSVEGKLLGIVAIELCSVMATVSSVELGALIDNIPATTNNLLAHPSTQDIVDLIGTDASPDRLDGIGGHGPVIGEAVHERH